MDRHLQSGDHPLMFTVVDILIYRSKKDLDYLGTKCNKWLNYPTARVGKSIMSTKRTQNYFVTLLTTSYSP